jgi:hypothetical protein
VDVLDTEIADLQAALAQLVRRRDETASAKIQKAT